jgi:hypothetical protein
VQDSDVLFCPGVPEHYKLVWRAGFCDAVVRHPDLDEVEWSTRFATVGGGRVATPVVLGPGETWYAEFSFRKHYEYWKVPDFETEGTPVSKELNTWIRSKY